jgi:hypothetical protein
LKFEDEYITEPISTMTEEELRCHPDMPLRSQAKKALEKRFVEEANKLHPNALSCNPEQTDEWLRTLFKAVDEMFGVLFCFDLDSRLGFFVFIR